MAQQQQTVLKVQSNKVLSNITVPDAALSIISGGTYPYTTAMLISGSGTTTNPYTGITESGATFYGYNAYFLVTGNTGSVSYSSSGNYTSVPYKTSDIYIYRDDYLFVVNKTAKRNTTITGQFDVLEGDIVWVSNNVSGVGINYLYIETNTGVTTSYQEEVLDLYTDIPIKINKSFAELQDIARRNSDYSIGLQLPGSKTNNVFFESYFDVDSDTLYFNPLSRVPAKVLINDEIYFNGYLKLNRVSIINSKIEYDVTLFSNVGDLFGKIGNNLLKDLPFNEPTLRFNHNFGISTLNWDELGFSYTGNPKTYIYPITHNGYEYSGDTVNLSGATLSGQTRLYTTSAPISGFTNTTAMYAAGVKDYRINVPANGILDNQLKPALNVWALIQLMFRSYGYTIKSDFMNTPWMKGLYMYGYFNSDTTKFSYKNVSGDTVYFEDGEYVNFSVIINEQFKQIDFLSSIAKKFNLLFIPDPEVKNQIIIEPYQYYVGTGSIYDWTDKLSYDKGFSVEPAQNFVESELILTDLEDGDDGNKQFKEKNTRIYGQNFVFNQTDFKSSTKRIETIFSPQVFRKWDDNVAIPLGMNYVSANSPETTGGTEKVKWTYKGVKTKPKLFYYLGNKNPFLNIVGEAYYYTSNYTANTFSFNVSASDNSSFSQFYDVPVISNTMPLGNPDDNKLSNDNICILFNSEEPTDVGVETYNGVNAFTENDMYKLFYENRINNLYDPNTRFLNGYFNLKLSDIKNLSPKDIIKIKEQYFSWNKIDGFNMTNPELTKVELVQIDNNPSTYPTRYFQYSYCSDPELTYGIKTDFTNPVMLETFFYISNYYDYFVGLLGGNVSGFTSSWALFGGSAYMPFTMYEVDKDTYDAGTDTAFDPNVNLYNQFDALGYLDTTWLSLNYVGLNLFESCADFATAASTYSINVATPINGTPVSIYHSGITINVTNTGWIKYDTEVETVYRYFGSLGNQDIPDCADCSTIRYAYPFADLAEWTVVDCGSPCP